MKTYSRRGLLLAGTAFAGLSVTAGSCGGAITPAQVVSVAQNAIGAIANTLKAVGAKIPAAISTEVNGYLADANSVLSGLSAGLQATSGAPIIQQIEGDLNAIITAAASLPLVPPPFSTALGAAAVALPILEAFVNAVIPAAAASPAAIVARGKFAPSGMTQAEAQAALAKLAGR